MLTEHGARPWQIEQILPILMAPMRATEPLVVPEPLVEGEGEGEVQEMEIS